MAVVSVNEATALRVEFFNQLFPEQSGYLCIAHSKPFQKETFQQKFFEWPKDKEEITAFLDFIVHDNNVWFCVNLLSEPKRKKEFCLPTDLVWADLDEVDPREIPLPPQIMIQSSPKHYQGIWKLDRVVQPYAAEDYSRRLAYAVGADKSGWDLTQLLRVPLTNNYKYPDAPPVIVLQAIQTTTSAGYFEELPTADEKLEVEVTNVPVDLPDPKGILYKYASMMITRKFQELYYYTPRENDDWSTLLWKLINTAFECGATREEVYVLAHTCQYNKYVRDGRPPRELWRDVIKAEEQRKRIKALNDEAEASFQMPDLLQGNEPEGQTLVDEYRSWAESSTDAVPEYHDLCCFMILSSLLAANLEIKTSYDTIQPNLWGLLLGNSTLTRKSTCLRMAQGFISDIDKDLILGTDASPEGLVTGLQGRAGEVSVFLRDEISGLFEGMKSKGYMSDLKAMMTGLYDVPPIYQRRLRKETILVEKPVFILFGGGIRDKVYEQISDDWVIDGFLPRFLVVNGNADIQSIRVTGPASNVNVNRRQELFEKFNKLYELYHTHNHIQILNSEAEIPTMYEVVLTDEAWQRYGEIELMMVDAANSSSESALALPTFERLSRSLLKMAGLLAATRQAPQEGQVRCTSNDINHAAKYIQAWGKHSIELIQNAGVSYSQRMMQKIVTLVEENQGISRATIMRRFHINSREMGEFEKTLQERGQLLVTREGRVVTYVIT